MVKLLPKAQVVAPLLEVKLLEFMARFALLESFHIFLTSTHLFPEEQTTCDRDLRWYKNNQTKGWPLITWATSREGG